MLILFLIFTSTLWLLTDDDRTVLTVFHAGSLAIPFEELEKRFEELHPDVDVRREVSGSAAAVRKLTELDRSADIVATADHSLIGSMMMENDPKLADWYIQFAKNQMILAYTDRSRYRDNIDQDNWFDVLLRTDVRFGFSNPNDDPCGYRALMVIQLAGLHYNRTYLFDELIEKNTGVVCSEKDGSYSIIVPETPEIDPDTDKIMMRSAAVGLISALELGEMDYLFIYRSVAYQHRESGVEFLELPEAVDLSSADHADLYGRVELIQASGNEVRAKPIVYGITIPSTVKKMDLALDFVEMLLGTTGRQIFNDNGQPPLVPAVASDNDGIPGALKRYVRSNSTSGT